MKKLFLLIAFIGIVTAQAQTPATLTFSNMNFGPGTITAKIIDTTGFVSPTAGINQVWNYASLTPTATSSYTSISPASAYFPTATYADTNLSAPFVPGWYYHYNLYYKNDATADAILGIELPLQNYSITAISGGANDSCYILPQHVDYNPAMNMIVYPATMNSAWQSTYTDVINFQLTIVAYMMNHTPCQKITHYIRQDTIIGWGTATIPAAGGPSVPYSCLLEKRVTVAADSFYMNGAPAPAPLLSAFGLSQGQQTISNRYMLWRENSNYPLMIVNYGANNFTKPTSVVIDANVGTAGIPNISDNETVNVFPNPASDKVSITGVQNADVSISDISGRIVYRNNNFNSAEPIDISIFEKGNYIIRIISKNNTVIKKLVVL
ncbi:MAG: T9SS type A sorting domain-containing protein [Bacteroidota bacterium]